MLEFLFVVAVIWFVVALIANVRRRRKPDPEPSITVDIDVRPVTVETTRPARRRKKQRNVADWPALLDREDVLVVDVETTLAWATALRSWKSASWTLPELSGCTFYRCRKAGCRAMRQTFTG